MSRRKDSLHCTRSHIYAYRGLSKTHELYTHVYQLHTLMKLKKLTEHAYRPEAKEMSESNSDI